MGRSSQGVSRTVRSENAYEEAEGHGGGDALPRQLPEGEEDGEFVVELLKLIKSAEDKLRLILTFPQDPHHVRLHREDKEETAMCQCFTSRDVMEHGHDDMMTLT